MSNAGNIKTDLVPIQGAGFSTTTDSLKIISDGIDNELLRVAFPTADLATNTTIAHVIGNKADAAVTDVTATNSTISYVKGLIQELDQRKVSKFVFGISGNNVFADIINITDKGVLNGISIDAQSESVTQCQGYIRITIDGTVIYTGATEFCIESPVADKETAYRNFCFNHRFNTSLRIELKNTDTTKATISAYVSYTTDD